VWRQPGAKWSVVETEETTYHGAVVVVAEGGKIPAPMATGKICFCGPCFAAPVVGLFEHNNRWGSLGWLGRLCLLPVLIGSAAKTRGGIEGG